MIKQEVDQIITSYLPKLYGYATKKAFYFDEAEELCSEITETVYLSLLSAREVYNLDGYIWGICQRVYAKYVADKKKHQAVSLVGMDISDGEGIFSYEEVFFSDEIEDESRRLRREIAFLTQLRREIIYSFYYEKKPVSYISTAKGIPKGTVKWHLYQARDELKKGMEMERKVGKLGLNPVRAVCFGHDGDPGKNLGPEYYLGDLLNLNIVYSVYFTPRTEKEIAEELGITPVFIEDRIKLLVENGFLVKKAGDRYTTYVHFNPESFSQERKEAVLKKKTELAQILVKEYVPLVRAAVTDMQEIYIPGGNRELFEAAVIEYAVFTRCRLSLDIDLSRYRIKTTDDGQFIAYVQLPSEPIDPEYQYTRNYPSYWSCGSMTRGSFVYPSLYSWSIDTRYTSRTGSWQNNLTTDYDYLYEYITGMITENSTTKEKFDRLRERKYISADGSVNVMVVKDTWDSFVAKIPEMSEDLRKRFADYALESATAIARSYPAQMRDLVIANETMGFFGGTGALMVKDILYDTGIFRPLKERERIATDLLVFCDTLPKE